MSAPSRVSTVLPALRGRGVLLAAPADADRIRTVLVDSGFAIAEADLGDLAGQQNHSENAQPTDKTGTKMGGTMRMAQAALAEALRLPETAGRNLDALVDSLRDLALWWPESDKVVLVLHGAQALVDRDLPGWHTLTEILREASADLWRDGGPGDRAFETVALVEGHGVRALREGSAESEADA